MIGVAFICYGPRYCADLSKSMNSGTNVDQIY